MKIKSIILCFFVIPLLACECSMEPVSYPIEIHNKSEVTISYHVAMGDLEPYWEGNAYPDTTLTFNRHCVGFPIKPNSMTWEDFYDRTNEEWFLILPADTMSVYFFNYDTLQHYSWETIQSEYKILQRYDLSIEDLHLLDYEIVYPPSEMMKNMKMYPPYKRE